VQPQIGQEPHQRVDDWKEVDSQVSERAFLKSNFSRRRPYMKRKNSAVGPGIETNKASPLESEHALSEIHSHNSNVIRDTERHPRVKDLRRPPTAKSNEVRSQTS
jgi:hypothetical protein